MLKLYQKKFWVEHYNDPKYVKIRTNILESFKDLLFEEGPHKYYLNGKEMTCVSNVTHMFKEHFDADEIAMRTFERNYDKPDSKYYRMTVNEIKASWQKTSDDACTHGTNRHLFAESIFYFVTNQFEGIADEYKDRVKYDDNGTVYFEAIAPEEVASAKFYQDMPECCIPILAETKVYREDLGYSGTFDLLTYYDAELDGKTASKSGLQIRDWKTNKDLYKNFGGKTLLYPFQDLLDMSLNIYKLQLSLYQLCLEWLGYKIVSRHLMWLKPNETYEKIPLESYTTTLEKYLTEHPIKNNC